MLKCIEVAWMYLFGYCIGSMGKGTGLLIDFLYLVSRFFFAVQLVQSCMNFLTITYLFLHSHCRKWMSST